MPLLIYSRVAHDTRDPIEVCTTPYSAANWQKYQRFRGIVLCHVRSILVSSEAYPASEDLGRAVTSARCKTRIANQGFSKETQRSFLGIDLNANIAPNCGMGCSSGTVLLCLWRWQTRKRLCRDNACSYRYLFTPLSVRTSMYNRSRRQIDDVILLDRLIVV
jgi:hypothetical protein